MVKIVVITFECMTNGLNVYILHVKELAPANPYCYFISGEAAAARLEDDELTCFNCQKAIATRTLIKIVLLAIRFVSVKRAIVS